MKNIFRHKSILSAVLAGTLAAGSCTGDFDKMNVSPNSPTSIGPQYLLPTGIETSIDRYWGHRERFERINIDAAELYVQHLTRNIYSNEGDDYTVSPALLSNNWRGFYNEGLLNFQRIIVQTREGSENPNANYEGIALVMRTWVFSLLTDMYGSIPYSDAIRGTADQPNYTPKYDSMEDIYAGMLADLKTANEKLTVGGPMVAGDILYSGDILKWKKFANSLRLRLANRQAAKKPAESKAIMTEILSDASKFPVFTSNADNASLKCTTVLPSNNEWNQILIQGGRTDWNISKTLADRMNELGDTRITVYANANKDGLYQGHPNGLPDAIATSYLATSSTIGDAFTKADAPEVIMTFADLNFILAEAALDGDITGDAKQYFEKGITASFGQYGLTVPAGYLAKVGAVTREKVLEQKWISLYGQGVEAWIEWRRTGLPVFPSHDPRAVLQNGGILPTRFNYPSSEYSLNKGSVDAGTSLNGGPDDMKTKLWWAEK
ncbi:SusD/RagB family nutrient-binding outer membrane lipoprotein [Dyadobacter sandarakinus]|uniref:SusD/RagB family nutrient-binding outer membrane lipoprotein n=1 Tax=Dyadobacter sandarakinus TaxID=2747268 RepID=A0ABX7ICI6_9BACT|nr:SusD/RagB family nutrient-binding outer membrane lipoprotein [Dyadobacter sandarakinus]QRR03834.1 SusD/RagB family nutrient-binding outer membrane lipoprotein [Dyadobacter sandarakinus]